MKIRMKIIFPLVLLFTACTPMRQPVPPGTIPDPTQITDADRQAGAQAKQMILQRFPEETKPALRNRVKGIVLRILRAQNIQEEWDVVVLKEDRVANAAATRGPVLFVWTGMLKELPDDDTLAAVLAHEVAHVLAGHVIPDQAESVNRMLAQVAGALAGRAVQSPGGSQAAGQIAQQTVSGLIVNPYSQRLEYEADTVGLFLMAEAGYNPEAALKLWEVLQSSSSRLAAFFSTHPPSEERIANLRQHLPEAKARYRP